MKVALKRPTSMKVSLLKRSKPKPDLRKEIQGAKIIENEKEAVWKRFIVIQQLRKKLKLQKLKKENELILNDALEDATVTSNMTVPKTLEEALPQDAEKKANDPRAIVVTEAFGSFNMVGCNKAWEVRSIAG